MNIKFLPVAIILGAIAGTVFAQTTTQPIPTTAPATTRHAPVHQLTTLISAAVLKIEHLPPSSGHDEKVAAINADLKGQRVYGGVIVDMASEGFINAHLLWHDKAPLNVQEQKEVDGAKQQADKAQADYANAVVTYNQQIAAYNAAASSHGHGLSNQVTVTDNRQSFETLRNAANTNLKTVTKAMNDEAVSRLPQQTLAITTNDPKAKDLHPKALYSAAGVITEATESVDAAGFVSFAVKISPAP